MIPTGACYGFSCDFLKSKVCHGTGRLHHRSCASADNVDGPKPTVRKAVNQRFGMRFRNSAIASFCVGLSLNARFDVRRAKARDADSLAIL